MLLPPMLTNEWIEKQLQICKAASQGPWHDGFDDGSGRIIDDFDGGAYITFGELNQHGLPQKVIRGADCEGIPVGVLKQEDVDFIIAAREGYPLVLKEWLDLRNQGDELRAKIADQRVTINQQQAIYKSIHGELRDLQASFALYSKAI